MASGRKTGGRRKGTPNKATAKRQAEIAATGATPLDYMLAVMRDKAADPHRRDEMAKAAAVYVHPRLGAIRHTGANDGPIGIVEMYDVRDKLGELIERTAAAAEFDEADTSNGVHVMLPRNGRET